MKVQVLYCAHVELTILALNYVIGASTRKKARNSNLMVRGCAWWLLRLENAQQILVIGRGRSPFYTPLAQRTRARGYGPRYAGSIPVWGTLDDGQGLGA